MLFLCVAVFSACFPNAVSADVSAKAAVVFSPSSGEMVFDKSGDEKLSMASTTKIMTTLLALEYISENGDKQITITGEMANVEGSAMGLKAGDKISLYNLCVGMMMCSGNDAANSVAVALGKGDFAKMMNARAKEIGMNSTSFVTASGLDDENHYTTAKDMALLGAKAMENPDFERIVSSKSMNANYKSKEKGEITVRFKNHNKLLSFMEDCVGIKTGFTKKSGRCLVSAVRRNGVLLICVTLNAPDDWNDHIALYDYCFQMLKTYTPSKTSFSVPTSDGSGANLVLDDESPIHYFNECSITEAVYLPRFIYNESGRTFGRVDYIRDGKVLCSRSIISPESVSENTNLLNNEGK